MAKKLGTTPAPAATSAPDPDVMNKHFRDIAQAQGNVKTATGALGPLVKKAEEDGWDKAAGMFVLKLEKMDALKRETFWKHVVLYAGPGYRNLFAQTSLFAADAQAKTNATTPPDTTDRDKRNEIAEEQGYQAGLAAHDPMSCTFPENDAARPFWQKGWRRGQNENANKFKADTPAADATPNAAPELEMPAFLDRTKQAAAPAATEAPKRRGRPPKVPEVPTHDAATGGSAFH